MNKSSSIVGSFALKLDMSKAYDRVDWGFLSNVLHSFGIHGNMHSMIMNCTTTATLYIILSGQPKGFITSERGIRQGCPLSPYLFILCSQSLSKIMRRMELDGLYYGYKVNRWAPSVSHLMFADDVMPFGCLTSRMVDTVTATLEEYSKCSGQVVNYIKSGIYFSKAV